jgi:hypothetical protein
VRIDRAAFLGLTSAIACNTAAPPIAPGAGSVVEIPTQPPQPIEAGAPIAPRAEEPPKIARSEPEPAEEPEDDPDDPDSSSTRATRGCGWVDPASVSRPAGACTDDKGAPGACTAMKSCSGVAFPKTKCEAFKKYFKPRVAQRAVECLAKITDKQACDACNAYRCGETALKTSCDDASADATCAQITSKCKAISMSDCRTYLSGMNGAGRAKMAFCLGQPTGCGFGIFSCAEGLF